LLQDSWTTSIASHPGPRRAALESALRSAIREGRLAAGTRLPSSRALAADLGLARGTIVEAYAQLRAEGYLRAHTGGGTWVANVGSAPQATRAPAAPAPAPRFDFHPGQPDLSSFPAAAWTGALKRGLRRTRLDTLGYGDPRGRVELREELAGYLGRARGAIADPELIVVCCGFRHALSLVTRVLRARGARRIAVEDPCAPPHLETIAASGLATVPLPVDADGARTDLLSAARAHAAVLGPAHQYPLGVVLHPLRRAAAIEWARASDAFIVEDDYDAELRYDRQPVGALQALAPEHVAYGGTASKTLVPGLRLGWLVLPPSLVDDVVALRLAEDVHAPATDQIAFAELLRSGQLERHIRRMRVRYRRRRDHLIETVAQRAPAVTISGLSAGLNAVLEVPEHGPSVRELVDRASEQSLRLYTVAGREAIVAGYGALPEHAFDAGIRALGDLLADCY
jgi:GntR family transcriptional regulator/MocR family aminotransferase